MRKYGAKFTVAKESVAKLVKRSDSFLDMTMCKNRVILK